MEALIFFSVLTFLCFIIVLFSRLFQTEKIYEESFWWDTWDGLNFIKAYLMKFKYLPFYYIKHYVNTNCNHYPDEHPKYKEFLLKC